MNMTSETFAASTRDRINDTSTQDLEYYEPEFQLVEDGGTAHLSIIAADGSAVTVTSTINLQYDTNQ